MFALHKYATILKDAYRAGHDAPDAERGGGDVGHGLTAEVKPVHAAQQARTGGAEYEEWKD